MKSKLFFGSITLVMTLLLFVVPAIGTRYCLYYIPHTYVYRDYIYLIQGVQYIWNTRDLQGDYPDTYMYLVRGETIVAENDDYNGLASLIAYVPSVSGSYYLIIRAYSKCSSGTCDVYEAVGGGSPTRIGINVKFGGYKLSAHWKADETILTRNATADTYLFLIHGNTMLRDDDSGYGLCSRIRPGYEQWGYAIVGSYSTWTGGITMVCNHYQSYLDNPGTRDEAMDDPKIVISEAMVKFQTELTKEKPSLEELSHQDREARVRKLRDSILSLEDISQLGAPKIPVPKEYIAAFERYEELLKVAEEKLDRLSDAERAAEMAKMERKKREIFGDLVPQEEPEYRITPLLKQEAYSPAEVEFFKEHMLIEQQVIKHQTPAKYEELTGNKIDRFSEAPMLRVKVANGELPPLKERLPVEPMVVEPLEEIGRYGGTLEESTTDIAFTAQTQYLFGLSFDLETVVNIVKGWDISTDQKTLTVYLREGMKWSDGCPFTADDIMFWYEDIILNDELTPVKPEIWSPGGRLVEVEKIDDYTIRFLFAVPYLPVVNILATTSRPFAAKHYLKKWHITYNSRANELAETEGFNYWWQCFEFRNPQVGGSDVNLPSLDPWVLKQIDSYGNRYFERNPYYWKVDIAGNQLPYIDEQIRVSVR